MASVNRPSDRWIMRGAALVVVFVGALSMHVEQFVGWGFFFLCFLAGSLGGLGYLLGRDRLLVNWNRLPPSRRAILVILGIALTLVVVLIASRHKPDHGFADAVAALGILSALAVLWGAYRITSHLLDVLHERFSKR